MPPSARCPPTRNHPKTVVTLPLPPTQTLTTLRKTIPTRPAATFTLAATLALMALGCADIGPRPARHTAPLDARWELSHQGQWLPATVPGTVHTDLMANGVIPNPFEADNEQRLRWIGDTAWTYRATFDMPPAAPGERRELVFHGVDCHAGFRLNGAPLLHQEGGSHTANMFRRWTFELPADLPAQGNVLEIDFAPSRRHEQARAQAHPYPLPDTRVFSRKAPYQSGWDWGPDLATCGLWRPVELRRWTAFRVDDLHARQTSLDDSRAELEVDVTVVADTERQATVRCDIDGQPHATATAALKPGVNVITLKATILNPRRWKPNGLGRQEMHVVQAVVQADGAADSQRRRVGLRDITLDRSDDATGQAFTLSVDGRPTFMKGANWIPADFFPHRVTPDRYRRLLEACRDANFNMVRVWGGGVYESDTFYDICDELGLLVWQDFMYACALYPADPAFLADAGAEAAEQVRRLRHHPCLALWCGNNEVKNGWDDWGWQANYDAGQRAEIGAGIDALFGRTLADTVAAADPGRPYVSTSPLWGWGHPECVTHGHSHYWGVWWGEQPFEVWGPKTGRFMSEYGFQAYPEASAIAALAPDPADRHFGSPALRNHQKHARGRQIIGQALRSYLVNEPAPGGAGAPISFDDYLYLSQIAQAHGLTMAIDAHRSRRPHCMGSLYWQANDCWPVASWSTTDYLGNHKGAHFAAARRFAPISVVAEAAGADAAALTVANDRDDTLRGALHLRLLTFGGDELSAEIRPLAAPANAATPAGEYRLPSTMAKRQSDIYLQATLRDAHGAELATTLHYFAPPKDLRLPASAPSAPTLRHSWRRDGEVWRVRVEADALHRWVRLQATPWTPGAFSDNFFDLAAGETREITFRPHDPQIPGMPYNGAPADLTFDVTSYNQIDRNARLE